MRLRGRILPWLVGLLLGACILNPSPDLPNSPNNSSGMGGSATGAGGSSPTTGSAFGGSAAGIPLGGADDGSGATPGTSDGGMAGAGGEGGTGKPD